MAFAAPARRLAATCLRGGTAQQQGLRAVGLSAGSAARMSDGFAGILSQGSSAPGVASGSLREGGGDPWSRRGHRNLASSSAWMAARTQQSARGAAGSSFAAARLAAHSARGFHSSAGMDFHSPVHISAQT